MKNMLVHCLVALFLLAGHGLAGAQSLSSVKSAERAVQRAKENVQKAQENVDKAQKAVDDEIQKGKDQAKDDPKGHGTNPELEKLRGALKKAKSELGKAQKALEKAEEKLRKAKEKYEEAQRKRLEEALKQKPLPDNKQELEKYKGDLENWKNGIWGTEEGEDLKRRLREKIDEKLRRLENNEQSALPENNRQRFAFAISLGGTIVVDNRSSQFVAPELFYQGLSSPEVYSDLYEGLGGEFIIGALTNSGFTGVEMSGGQSFIPGLGMGLSFPSGIEFGVQINRFKTDWSGSFPFTLFPFEGTSPQTLQGSVNRNLSGITIDMDARYFLSMSNIRPYLNAGIRGQWTISDQTSVWMGSATFPIATSALSGNRISPYAGAGVRMHITPNAFVQTSVSVAKMQGSDYSPNLHVSMGWKFR